MLICDEIKAAIQEGKLFPVAPLATRTREKRTFLKCLPLHEELEKGKRDENEKVRQRWAKLEAAMIHFVERGRMTRTRLKQLEPPKFEHWELLNKRPRPSLRVFGRFALPNVFVGTHVVLRKSLGEKWSSQWEHQKLVCEDHYSDAGLTTYFSDSPDFKYEAYITEHASATLRIAK